MVVERIIQGFVGERNVASKASKALGALASGGSLRAPTSFACLPRLPSATPPRPFSYTSIKDFLTWTTSRNTAVRVFYLGFAVILYDMWLLVDLLIEVNLDIEHRLKLRVPARTFLNIARKDIPVT